MGSSRSTKAERAEEHRIRMEMRRIKNAHNSKELADSPQFVRANLSWDHEHFADTPRDHEKRKNSS
jgi:hypothetical protein